MTDQHKEDVWQRSDARRIMKDARKTYRLLKAEGDYVGAHTGLAVDHYSLVKQYRKPWLLHLAVWHLWRAVAHDLKAVKIGLRSAEQIDVVSRHLSRSPFRRHKLKAQSLIRTALDYVPVAEPQDEMYPHTRALMLITLGDIETSSGGIFEAGLMFMQAVHMREDVFREADKLMAKRQWARIASACGFWFFDHRRELQTRRDPPDGAEGVALGFALQLLPEALGIALAVSQDQAAKIQEGCRERGLGFENQKALRSSLEAYAVAYKAKERSV